MRSRGIGIHKDTLEGQWMASYHEGLTLRLNRKKSYWPKRNRAMRKAHQTRLEVHMLETGISVSNSEQPRILLVSINSLKPNCMPGLSIGVSIYRIFFGRGVWGPANHVTRSCQFYSSTLATPRRKNRVLSESILYNRYQITNWSDCSRDPPIESRSHAACRAYSYQVWPQQISHLGFLVLVILLVLAAKSTRLMQWSATIDHQASTVSWTVATIYWHHLGSLVNGWNVAQKRQRFLKVLYRRLVVSFDKPKSKIDFNFWSIYGMDAWNPSQLKEKTIQSNWSSNFAVLTFESYNFCW